MDRERFLHEIERRGAWRRPADVERAAVAALRVLGARLHELDARAIADDLPAPFAEHLRRGEYEGAFGIDDFYRRVAELEGVGVAEALEHAQVVCQVVGHAVSEGGWKHLLAHLTDEWHDLFRAPERPAAPPATVRHGHQTAPPGGRSLASGRPGSQHPLSEAEGAPAHSGSVVRGGNPHERTKLSSARKPGEDDDRPTLATGRPGSRHPVSESGKD